MTDQDEDTMNDEDDREASYLLYQKMLLQRWRLSDEEIVERDFNEGFV
jgi:hypothetical protein